MLAPGVSFAVPKAMFLAVPLRKRAEIVCRTLHQGRYLPDLRRLPRKVFAQPKGLVYYAKPRA